VSDRFNMTVAKPHAQNNVDVYLLLEDHDNPGPYDAVKALAGEEASVSGKKFIKGGVQSILVSETKAQ